MALRNKPRGRWWSRLHFLVRFVGLNGLLVCAVGLMLALVENVTWTQEAIETTLRNPKGEFEFKWAESGTGRVPQIILHDEGDLLQRLALQMLLFGGAAALLALLIDALVMLRLVAGRR